MDLDLKGTVAFALAPDVARTLEAIAAIPHGIELLNDDTTPMDFVVDVLRRHLGLDQESATLAMLAAHNSGRVGLPTTSHAEAVRVSEAITAEARERNLPLVCRVMGNA